MKIAFLSLLSISSIASANVLVDFSDKPLPPNSNLHNAPFVSNGTTFSNNYAASYDGFSGFALSNVNNPTTPGFTNQYAAVTGTDVSGTGTYAIDYSSGFINLPEGERASSVRLTNTTYAALSMRDGDSFAKKFGGATGTDPDFFTVTFTGYAGAGATGATTGASTFYLADFRGAGAASDYIVTNWSTLDLTPLGNARSIGLSYASSDVGQYGVNTPKYVAIDDLRLVPEPTTLGAIAMMLVALRRRR